LAGVVQPYASALAQKVDIHTISGSTELYANQSDAPSQILLHIEPVASSESASATVSALPASIQ
jgi:hypothetical protein